jgi:hypothetical protein
MKNYLEFINEEVGQSMVRPYPYQKTSDDKLATYYKFITDDEDQYIVRFFHMGEFQHKEKLMDKYQVEFVVGGDLYDAGDRIVVNKGRFYKVISTIIFIIKEFVKEHDPKELKINPVSNFKKDKRRKNIYIRYIEKMLPDTYKYKKAFFGDSLYIRKKD